MNIIGFVCEAFGYNSKIYKDIDKLYQTKKYEFYRLAKQSEWYTHQLLTEGSLLQEEYCKKALGIFEYLSVNEDDIDSTVGLSEIIKKGWGYVCQFVESRKIIQFQDFMEKYIRKNKGIENLTDDEINTALTMLLLCANSSGCSIDENDATYKCFMSVLFARLEHYNKSNSIRISISNATPEELEDIKKLKTKIALEIGNVKDYASMLKYLNNPSRKDERICEALQFMFDYENITSSLLWEIPWTEKDNDELLYAWLHWNTEGENLAQYFISAMHIRYLLKAYKENKEHYFKNNKETQFAELEEKEKEVIRLMSKLEQKEANETHLNEQIVQLQKTVELQKTELLEERQKNNELIGLREFMFKQNNQIEYVVGERYLEDELKKLKVAIIGGHSNWQSRMKESLPESVFIHTDQVNYDLSILDNVCIVFFYPNYMNHAIYYRTIDYLKNTKKKIRYLNQSNKEMALCEIWKHCVAVEVK